MSGEVDILMENLKEISLLIPGKTFSSTTKKCIHHKTIFSSLYRKRNSENRNKTMETIEEILNQAFKLVDVHPELHLWIERSRDGLLNLKKTYENDERVMNRIHTSVDRIDQYLRDEQGKIQKNIVTIDLSEPEAEGDPEEKIKEDPEGNTPQKPNQELIVKDDRVDMSSYHFINPFILSRYTDPGYKKGFFKDLMRQHGTPLWLVSLYSDYV